MTSIVGLPPSRFMVPYARNRYFTGRNSFLEQIFDKLGASRKNDRYPGRLALFGMGGVGKTQIALEFVYRYRSSYDWIYWISAASQGSLLDGYRKIAKEAKIKIPEDSQPIDLATSVLSWFGQNENWLLVIDNLDDINAISTNNLGLQNIVTTLLPMELNPRRQTLITTRNRNADNIPAQALEVPLFHKSESIDLLSSLSNIPVVPKSAEFEHAEKIVEELDHLPLAIAQAAAYIKTVQSGTFSKFLKHYADHRPRVNKWFPLGPQPYPHTVATTWQMSFNAVRNANSTIAKFFQLLAFFNGDGILIEFLRAGALAMDEDLQVLLSHEFELPQVLLRLETFSLLKWNRQDDTLVVHRLVQAVVKDEMSDTDLTNFRVMTANICNQSFPQEWTNENRELCRIYVGQLMRPLLDIKVIRTEQLVNIMYQVGWFLREDGKISDSERFSLQAVKICTEMLSDDHPHTLMAKGNLASTYQDQGRTTEVAAIQEQMLEKMRRILGDDHLHTLLAMGNLALTYRDQGRTAEAAALEEQVLEKRRRITGNRNENR